MQDMGLEKNGKLKRSEMIPNEEELSELEGNRWLDRRKILRFNKNYASLSLFSNITYDKANMIIKL